MSPHKMIPNGHVLTVGRRQRPGLAICLGILCLGFGLLVSTVDAFRQPQAPPRWKRRTTAFLTQPALEASTCRNNDNGCRRQSHCFLSTTYHRRHLPSSLLLAASSSDDFVQAQDLEALQALFAKYCDNQGLMTKSAVMQVPAIADLLNEGDLLEEEFDDIWNKAPKFPDVETSGVRRIDVDSFVQVYRDIDDLFEDDGDSNAATTAPKVSPNASPAPEPLSTVSPEDAIEPSILELDDEEDEVMEAELESIFESLCDANKLVSKSTVKGWDEVAKLMEEGLLGDDEFDDLWKKTAKSPGSDDQLDVDGFLSFNVALDGLFDFDDEEMDDGELTVDDDNEDDAEEVVAPEVSPPVASLSSAASPALLVDGEGLSPPELFQKLASDGKRQKLNREGVLRWNFLREVLDDGDLTEAEFDSLFDKAAKGKNDLNQEGFVSLYKAIDDLFEDEDRDDVDVNDEERLNDDSVSESQLLKQELFDTLEDFSDPNLMPCGLDFNEMEQKEILKIVSDLERQPSNLIRARDGEIDVSELNGSWDLLYSSSSAMRFNKGLSGLGGSFPNGKFGGLKQVLKSSKYVSDVEYIERIEVNPSAASFDVTVTGDWDLRRSVSLFTGEPSLVMTIEPGRVTYGLTSMKADHWKSLGPMNMLDISYLDEDLRIMRGNTAVDTIFIFRRATT